MFSPSPYFFSTIPSTLLPMALKNITLSVAGCVACSPGGVPLAAGDTVFLHLNQTLEPLLPDYITAVVQHPVVPGGVDHPTTREVVAGNHYTVQYDSADLNGVLAELAHCHIVDIRCGSLADDALAKILALENCVKSLKLSSTVVPPAISLTGPNGVASQFIFRLRDGSETRYVYENKVGDEYIYVEYGETGATSPTLLIYKETVVDQPYWKITDAGLTTLWEQIENEQTSPLGGYDDNDDPLSQPGTMIEAEPLVNHVSTGIVVTYKDADGVSQTVTLPWNNDSGDRGPFFFYFPQQYEFVSATFADEADITAGFTLETVATRICSDPLILEPIPAGATEVTIYPPTGYTKFEARDFHVRQVSGTPAAVSFTHVDLTGIYPVAKLDSAPIAGSTHELAVTFCKL